MMTVNKGYLERRSNSMVMLLVTLLLGLVLALVTTMVASGTQAHAAVDKRAVGPVGANGFPIWYQDAAGRRLDLCLDGPPLCLASAADLTAPDGEAFWWDADASMGNIGPAKAGRARLRTAVEAAFASADPNSQVAFGRIRVTADHLRPNTVYTVTHPYGVAKAKTDAVGGLRISRDVGAVPHAFGRALRSPVFDHFLRWDPKVGRKAPAGFLGNPNINHKVVGSPKGTNFFRIEGPNVGGTGPGSDRRATDLFSVQGKIR